MIDFDKDLAGHFHSTLRAYFPPDDLPTLEEVQSAFARVHAVFKSVHVHDLTLAILAERQARRARG